MAWRRSLPASFFVLEEGVGSPQRRNSHQSGKRDCCRTGSGNVVFASVAGDDLSITFVSPADIVRGDPAAAARLQRRPPQNGVWPRDGQRSAAAHDQMAEGGPPLWLLSAPRVVPAHRDSNRDALQQVVQHLSLVVGNVPVRVVGAVDGRDDHLGVDVLFVYFSSCYCRDSRQ